MELPHECTNRFYTDFPALPGNPHAARPPRNAPFRKYTLTDSEVEQDGYETGLNWTNNYRPGGPWVPGYDVRRDHPDWVAYAMTCERHNRLWLQGFDRGRARRFFLEGSWAAGMSRRGTSPSRQISPRS
jgi:hypothetical protein